MNKIVKIEHPLTEPRICVDFFRDFDDMLVFFRTCLERLRPVEKIYNIKSLSQSIKEAKSIPYLSEILDMFNHNNNFVIEYAHIMKNESKNE